MDLQIQQHHIRSPIDESQAISIHMSCFSIQRMKLLVTQSKFVIHRENKNAENCQVNLACYLRQLTLKSSSIASDR